MSAVGAHDFAGGRVRVFATTLACVLLATFAVVVGRVVQLQVRPGPRLTPQLQMRVSSVPIQGVRGDLADRRGRPLSVTRFGYRAFVDPLRFPDPPDEGIVRLAAAAGLSAEEVGERVIPRIAHNREARARAHTGPGEEEGEELLAPPVRYVSIGGILDDDRVAAVASLDIPGVHLERRQVREYPAADIAGPVVGKVGVDHDGLLGAERSYDGDLRGDDGHVRYVRDSNGRPLWVEPTGFVPARRGRTTRLSIDLELQRIAREELERGVEEADAQGGRIVLVDPATGEVLALLDVVRGVPGVRPFPWPDRAQRGSWEAPPTPAQGGPRFAAFAPDPPGDLHPALARSRCIEDVYEPGSAFKPFVWTSAIDLGLIDPDDRIDTAGGTWRTSYGRLVRDVVKRGEQTWNEVLVNSSNIGMARGSERMSFAQLHAAVRRFGFGERTGLPLPGESAGLVTSLRDWSRYTHTSVAFGYEVAVTPVQMARAFCAFARQADAAGTIPTLTLQALAPSAHAPPSTRALSPDAALLAREPLRLVAERMTEKLDRRESGTGRWTYTMFGKSGTANVPLGAPPPGTARPRGHRGYLEGQYNSSFVAAGPVERPRLVVVCVIDDPGPALVRENRYYGSDVAGPVVRRVMERALGYMGVPASKPGT